MCVVAISAAESNSVETLNTLKLASKARCIVNKPVVIEVRYDVIPLRYVTLSAGLLDLYSKLHTV